jgi:hypothetical protein
MHLLWQPCPIWGTLGPLATLTPGSSVIHTVAHYRTTARPGSILLTTGGCSVRRASDALYDVRC